MFGFNSITIDPKGRIAMPAKYRDILFELNTNKIVVTQDPQYPALKIYPQGVCCLLYTSPSPRDRG